MITAPRFVTELELREADRNVDDGKWLVEVPLVYLSAVARRILVVPAGFVTDLASVPRLPFVYMMCGGRANKPAALHDWLYTSGMLPRKDADAVFLEAMGVVGVPWLERHLMYLGVRLGGADHFTTVPPPPAGKNP